jgi:hypothetical protein
LWSPSGFAQALQLQNEFESRSIPVINPVDCLSNTAKLQGAELMRSAGIRTPRGVHIDDVEAFQRDAGGLVFPFLLREDRGHGEPALWIESAQDLERVDMGRFQSPIAVEYIETRSRSDGLFRKYRYVVAGDTGAPRHLILNNQWEVRPEHRVMNPLIHKEELAYVNSPDPNHAAFQRARQALGLDVIGFDYSYDHAGQVVVWEANPFPNLNYPKRQQAAKMALSVERSFAVVAQLYCQRAGLAIPPALARLLTHDAISQHDKRSLPATG